MKVRELINKLQMMEPESLVVMAKDPEGNGYSPLYEIDARNYEAVTTWYGDLISPVCVPSVVLWPVN